MTGTASAMRAGVVAGSVDAIVLMDADGTITVWNDAASRAYGHRAEDVIGEPVDVLIPAGRRDAERRMREQVVRGEHLAHFETRRERTDGVCVDISCTLSPIRGRDGSLVGLSSIERDISARHRWEQERDELLAEFRRSNQDLEQFAYVASHDLSEPLRVVSGMVQLLARRNEGLLDAESADYIERTLRATERMQTLINDLLAYSRAGRRRPADRAVVSTAEIVDYVLASLGHVITASGAEVTVGPLPEVVADATQLAQVFQNLIANAIKFGPSQGRPRVQVTAEHEADEWRFAVQDNGLGIDKRFHDRVFLIFKRLHTRDAYPGTGIGLAICKRIVENHGGTLTVQSEPGRGSTFRFTIPDVRS